MLLNTIIYLMLLLVTGAMASIFNNTLAVTPFLLLVILAFISLIYTFALRWRFKFTEHYDNLHYVRASNNKLQIEIVNNSILVAPHVSGFFFCADSANTKPKPEQLDFSIAPFSKRVIEYDLPFEHIGKYTVGLRNFRFNLSGLIPRGLCRAFHRNPL